VGEENGNGVGVGIGVGEWRLAVAMAMANDGEGEQCHLSMVRRMVGRAHEVGCDCLTSTQSKTERGKGAPRLP